MATYSQSGVNVEVGDKSSETAYAHAKKTFIGRKGMIGEPLIDNWGYTGAMDMGDFYIVANDDGVGTKMEVAELMNKYDTLGYDLLAMVADDAACAGAECISITNTIDADKVDIKKIDEMMAGLEKACLEQKVAVVGGEIAELSSALNGYVWNASAVGVMGKDKRITSENVRSGDAIIGFRSPGFRSNGMSLVRFILKEKFGADWVHAKYNENKTWGEIVLTPSIVYHNAIMALHGRYGEKPQVTLKGVAHITGGGIPGNICRILDRTGSKADLSALPSPTEEMQKVIELGSVTKEEAENTWNLGIGMVLVVDPKEQEKTLEIIKNTGYDALQIGKII